MADEYRYDPNDRGTQSGPGPGQQGQNQQGYHYNYNYKYSYGTGRGPVSPNGHKQPQQGSSDIGEWVAIVVLFMLPFGISQVIAIIWLVRKLIAMDSKQKQRYRQEAQRAAANARNTVADLLNMGRAGQPRPVGGMCGTRLKTGGRRPKSRQKRIPPAARA